MRLRLSNLCEDEFGPLVDYGILTEESTYRVHVCPKVGRAYVFRTKAGIKAIHQGKGRRTVGWTDILSEADNPLWCRIHGESMRQYFKPGSSWYSHLSIIKGVYHNYKSQDEWCNGKCEIITAVGYRVPPNVISGCKEVVIPPTLLERIDFSPSDSVGQKGGKAETLVTSLFKWELMPIQIEIETIDAASFQIKGQDLASRANHIFQVKCDYVGGSRKYGGSGYLYLQTKERNPFSQIPKQTKNHTVELQPPQAIIPD